MIIQKIEAIRMPKEISKYLEDSYILLFQCSIQKHILPNGRMQDMFAWTIPIKILRSFFCTKGTISNKMADYADEIKTYLDSDGKFYDLERLKKEIRDALKKARPIEEDYNTFTIGAHNFYTTEDLFKTLGDLNYHTDTLVDRGYYNLNETICNEAFRDTFIVKSGKYYVNEKNGNPSLSVEPGSAREFSTEDEALDFALSYSDSLTEDGYEIIKFEGLQIYHAMKFLREFRTPKE